MPKFTAVMGKSKTNRIMSIDAPTEDRARYLILQQLSKNPQRRDIRDQWVADGAVIVEQLEEAFDEAQANALIRGRLAELLAELSTGTVTVPAAVYGAYGRAKAALEAFNKGIVAESTTDEAVRVLPPHRVLDLTREEWDPTQGYDQEAVPELPTDEKVRPERKRHWLHRVTREEWEARQR